MKNYLYAIILAINPFAVCLFCAYLLGSFMSVSWNTELWTFEMRCFMVCTGLVYGVALSIKLRSYD